MKLAQTDIQLYDPALGNLKGFGPLGLEQGQDGVSTFAKLLSSAIGIITIIGIIWVVFILITGAVGIITSGGDKASLEGAKKRITSGMIGLVVLVTSLFILNVAGRILGIPAILDLSFLIKLL